LAIKSSLSSGLNEAKISIYRSVILVVSNIIRTIIDVSSAKVLSFF
jgi:hypothetical protein